MIADQDCGPEDEPACALPQRRAAAAVRDLGLVPRARRAPVLRSGLADGASLAGLTGMPAGASGGAALRLALWRDEFLPWFQPQVSAKTGALVGVEVLMRWAHPVRGILAPAQFMAEAEAAGLVPTLDRRMMEKALALAEGWQDRGLAVPRLAFNLSADHLHDPAILPMAWRLAEGRTPVAFELLESILAEEEGASFGQQLQRVRDLGIQIALDDFGSGHASFLGLAAVGPDVLKIDRRLVAPIAHDPRARHMVRVILDLARGLGIQSVAEGVETPAQARLLTGMGCDMLQGFHIARPLPALALESWLRR